ncbi:transcription factor bHLH95-like [Wolffia australiana]
MTQEAVDHGVTPWDNNNWVYLDSDNSNGLAGVGEKVAEEPGSIHPTEMTKVSTQKRRRKCCKKGKALTGDKDCSVGGEEPDHEIHIWTERERRKKMRNMFANLHLLLPQLPAKADKSTIVEEAIRMIRNLEASLKKLQNQITEKTRGVVLDSSLPIMTSRALSREAFMADHGKIIPSASSSDLHFSQCFQTWSSPNVVVSVTGADAHISICAVTRPGLISAIIYSLEKHKLDVLSAHFFCDYFRSMIMIHAQVNGTPDSFPEALPAEEIFKLAVEEIMTGIS